MNKNTTNIIFCSPDITPSSKKELVDALVYEATKNEEKNAAHFAHKKNLQISLLDSISEGDENRYTPLSKKDQESVEALIKEVSSICQEKLPLDYPLSIYVLPWFPGENDEMFNGTMGVTSFENTFQLKIDWSDFSNKSLRETIAHEYNHSVFFSHHSAAESTIFDSIIMEGLAEKFREEVVGGTVAPWSTALKKKEVKKALKKLEGSMDAFDYKLHDQIFYGSDNWKRWTGYSVGYRVVSSYLEKEQQIDWNEVMKEDPKSILQESDYGSI